jgi:ESS family glutamate:Na+ symporter
VTTWKLNPAQVLGAASFGIMLGIWLKRKLPILDRLNIPTPIAGGMIYAIIALALRDRVANLDVDTQLRDLLMIAFMTTVGLSARFQLLREGGKKLVLLFAISSIGAVLQNVLGIGLAKALSIDPRLGILAGSVALTGGPGTAVAFGSTFEKMGVVGAEALGMASATFGIAVAGLLGGYLGGWLIRRNKLKSSGGVAAVKTGAESGSLFTTVLIIGLAMGIGNILSNAMQERGVILPSYIGAMVIAALIRNLNDRFHFVQISQEDVNQAGRIALNLFIVMALIALKLWELAHLALPMIVILTAQVALCILMCLTMVYWIMGRNYESAVESAGFCGYMLGITANAVACMEELVEKYGPAPEAFLVVPVVGAFLIDFANSLIITTMANLLSR